MLNFRSILVFSENPGVLVEFYKKVFQSDVNWEGGDFKGFKVGGGEIAFGPHGKVKGKSTNPERIMFNLETEDVKGEFEKYMREQICESFAAYSLNIISNDDNYKKKAVKLGKNLKESGGYKKAARLNLKPVEAVIPVNKI